MHFVLLKIAIRALLIFSVDLDDVCGQETDIA